MDKRLETAIPPEDIQRQYEFIRSVREQSPDKFKKYYLSTFGCQMNENDSERLAGMLHEMGYLEAKGPEDSDLIIFNTCCVRENAEQKVYGHLGALKKLKQDRPDMIIAICGCMVQQQDVVEHIRKKYRHVKLIFGTHNLYRFPELLYETMNSKKAVIAVNESNGTIAEGMPIERKDGVKAWVTIMYGCNNFCTYCIVPYVRGRERSRGHQGIIEEAAKLGRQGFKEITLLGQNVNSYGLDLEGELSFAGLLHELEKIEGIERIRFMTSHPKDLSDNIITAIAGSKKLCRHIHLPVQAGSTRILKLMNRKYTKEDYLALVERIRCAIPGVAITTDIIVGFPGETEEDFLETLDILIKSQFDFAYTFLYSKRTGTPASTLQEQVSADEKSRRFERLLKVQNEISKEINLQLEGKVEEVLVEGSSKNSLTSFTGRTSTNKIVNFKGNRELIGKLVNVRIDSAQTWSLEGTIVTYRRK